MFLKELWLLQEIDGVRKEKERSYHEWVPEEKNPVAMRSYFQEVFPEES